jgi:hypothetical protein
MVDRQEAGKKKENNIIVIDIACIYGIINARNKIANQRGNL